jgi:hypothetical protein
MLVGIDEARRLVNASAPETEFDLYCEGTIMIALKEEFHITWKQLDLNWFRVTKKAPKQMSAKSEIEKYCQTYKGGLVEVDKPLAYVRVIVSSYNSQHGAKFSVKAIDGKAHIYCDVEDRKFITRSEFLAIADDYQQKLNEFKSRVRPDEFFAMSSTQYENGEPQLDLNTDMDEVDEEDEDQDEATVIPVDYPKPWIMRDCVECDTDFSTQDKEQVKCDNCLAYDEDIL